MWPNGERLKAKIWSRVDIPLGRWWERQCWEWQGALTTDRPDSAGGGGGGYGCMKVNGQWIRVHRLVWELLFGTIPDDRVVGHMCNNRKCVNPDHLELLTHKENNEYAYMTGQRDPPPDEDDEVPF